MKCFECNMEHPQHKMDCGSKSRMETLVWLLDSLQYLSDELLAEISFRVYVQSIERKLSFLEEDVNESI